MRCKKKEVKYHHNESSTDMMTSPSLIVGNFLPQIPRELGG